MMALLSSYPSGWLLMVSRGAIYALAVLGVPLVAAQNAGSQEPEQVVVRSGASLQALLWRPAGTGPFPAVLLNHGSGRTLGRTRATRSTRSGPKPSDPCLPDTATSSCICSGEAWPVCRPGLEQRRFDEPHGGGTRRDGSQRTATGANREASDARAALAFLRARSDVDHATLRSWGSFGSSLTR